MKSKKTAKTIGAIIGVILFSLLTAGITYAWYTWRSNNIDIAGSSTCFTINNTKGPNITQTVSDTGLILIDESTIISGEKMIIRNKMYGMAYTNVEASIDSSCTIPGNLSIDLTIDSLNTAFISGNSIGALKYIVASYDTQNGSIISNIQMGDLDDSEFDIIKKGSITSTSSVALVTEELSTTAKGYLIVFYVDGDLANNDAGNTTTTFKGTISATATQIAS